MTIFTGPPSGWGRWAVAAAMLITLAQPASPAEAPPAKQSLAAQPPSTQPSLTPLIDKIARGTPDDAAAATDELVRQIVNPVAAAVKSLEQRPPAEQRRLLEALGRLGAALRVRLYRADLPPQDAQLFDESLAHDHELVENLFDDDPRRRLAALYQIPLEPGSAAGVLVTSRLFDWDAVVVEAALKTAGRLGDDPATTRGLARFVEAAAQLVCSGRSGVPAEEAAAWTDFTRSAIRLLGEARDKSSVPAILEAIRCFNRPPQRTLFYVAEALEVLGKIGDERAVPLLLEHLEDREQHTVRALGPGKLLKVNVGDAALLALARIYGLSPDELGFVSAPNGVPATGFVDERSRRSALRAFTLWYKANGERPPEERTPLTTQSAPAAPASRATAEQP
jgi:hypothetical protein